MLIFVSFCQDLAAQKMLSKRRHQDEYDNRDVHFGFFFAPSTTNFNIKFNRDYVLTNPAYLITSPQDFTFKMGGLANFKLNDYFDFRVLPTISLHNRQVKFQFADQDNIIYKTETTWMEIPFALKYKSERRENHRMYMFGGGRVGFEGSARRKASKFNKLNIKQSDFSLEYGIGAEKFFEYFKFSPELHFSHGLNNMYIPLGQPYSVGINRLNTHTITLYLLFE